MKLAVFSDIHGNYQALSSILINIEKNNVDKIIYLGDAIGIGPSSLLCIKKIEEKCNVSLLGNHELYITRGYDIDPYAKEKYRIQHEYVKKSLKDYLIKEKNNLKYEINVFDKKYTFFHFFINDKNNYPFESLDIIDNNTYKEIFNKVNSDYIFYGHEHDIRFDEINGKQYYCVGSSGCRLNNKTYYYLITIDNDNTKIEIKSVKYNRKKFINSIKKYDLPLKENTCKKYYGIDID